MRERTAENLLVYIFSSSTLGRRNFLGSRGGVGQIGAQKGCCLSGRYRILAEYRKSWGVKLPPKLFPSCKQVLKSEARHTDEHSGAG